MPFIDHPRSIDAQGQDRARLVGELTVLKPSGFVDILSLPAINLGLAEACLDAIEIVGKAK